MKRLLHWSMPIIVVCSLLLQLALLTQGHNWGGDFSAYIMQAMSVVDGNVDDFVLRNRFAMQMSSEAVGPVTYPWGFPLLLAPVYALAGLDVQVFKYLLVLVYQLFLLVLWFGFADRLTRYERLALLAVFAFNPFLLKFANHILSDIPFLLCSTAALLMVDQLRQGRWSAAAVRVGVITGLLMASATLMRTQGILLVPVFMLAVLLPQPQWRVLWSGLASAGIMVLLSWWLLSDGTSSYVEQAAATGVQTVLDNTVYYAVLMREFFTVSGRFEWLGLSVYLMTLPCVALGIWVERARSWLFTVYALLTLALLLVWPYQQGLRFLFPLLPLYVYWGLVGLRWLTQRFLLAAWFVPSILAALVLMFSSASTVSAAMNLIRGQPVPEGPYTALAQEMFAFVGQQTHADDVMVFRKPRVMRLMTGRDALMYRTADDIRYGDYVIIDRLNQGDQLEEAEVQTLIAQGLLMAVFTNEQFDVYRRIH